MEKAIQSFDGITEWQDILGFLNKILKLLQNTKYTQIPKKLLLAKRLAQTMNPALPPGVHQKAIEVYQQIFLTSKVIIVFIETLQYAQDIHLWSMGLFPFLQHASMSVKV
jgi:hypothetical protein